MTSRRKDGTQKPGSGRISRRDLTENQLSIIELKKALEYYPLTPENINNLRDKVSDIETLKYMNMKYLAAALYILDSLDNTGPNADPVGFRLPTPIDMQTNSPSMNTAIQRIASESGKDSDRDIIKYKQVLLTYMIKVYSHLYSYTNEKLIAGGNQESFVEEGEEEESKIEIEEDEEQVQ